MDMEQRLTHPSLNGTHNKSLIREKPCEAKVSCTVLKTSRLGDKVAQFNAIAFGSARSAIAEARKTEAKKIRTLAEQAENQATRLRRYLTNQMLLSSINRIDGVSTKISLRKKQPTVLLNVPAEELPVEYVKVTHKPDLTKIRQLLKVDATGSIDWANLSENHEYSVTIR